MGRELDVRERKDEAQLPHLSDVVWKCPSCHAEAVRFDKDKKVFVCWKCCKILSEADGYKQLGGFGVGQEYFTYD